MDFLLIKKSNKNQKNLKIKNLGKSKKSKKGSKIENLKILKVRNGCQNYDDTFLFMRGLFLHSSVTGGATELKSIKFWYLY